MEALFKHTDGWRNHADIGCDTGHHLIGPAGLSARISEILVIPGVDHALAFDSGGEGLVRSAATR